MGRKPQWPEIQSEMVGAMMKLEATLKQPLEALDI